MIVEGVVALGIPAGIGLFNVLASDELAPARLSGLTYAAIAVAAPLAYAIVVAGPAWLLARQPVAGQLTYE